MRKKIVAANWKMNKDLEEGVQLAVGIKESLQAENSNDKFCILCPPFIHLFHLSEMLKGVDHIKVGAQNCHQEESGAYTGEVAASMIASLDVDYVILGHSERRKYFKEDDDLLARKVEIALKNNLKPIFCCGESLEQRETGTQQKVVEEQLKRGLFSLNEDQFKKVVIAYEPVWAIGTGKTASPVQAQEMHEFIRKLISDHYHKTVAEDTSILYGGSVKPDNAEDLFMQQDIDGGLIGGASLNADDFAAIYHAI